jgi:hypothetical protein
VLRVIVAIVALLTPASVRAAGRPVPRAALRVADGQPVPDLSSLASVPVAVRVPLDVRDAAAVKAFDEQTADVHASAVKLWIVAAIPHTSELVEPWRAALRQWLRAHRDRVAILELSFDREPLSLVSFAIREAATELHAANADAKVAVAPADVSRSALGQLLTPEVIAYLDFIAAPTTDAAEAALAALASNASALGALVSDAALPADADGAAASTARALAGALGSRIASIAFDAKSERQQTGAVRALAAMKPVLTGAVEVIDPTASSLTVDGRAAGSERSRFTLLFDNDSLSTLLYYDTPAGRALTIGVTVPVEGTPTVSDLVTGESRRADGYERSGASVHVSAPAAGHPMLIDFTADAPSDSFAARADVSAARQLTVEEIIANHRRTQARQDAEIRHYAAGVRMEQHFRPTVTDPGYDVLTENHLFVEGDDIEWEELSFSVNGSKFGANRPPFPLLQPEKVLSLPLQLRMTEDYRYRLAGTERVDGYDCYVVKFDPVQSPESRYRGTVWIDRRTFARVKIQAVQTNLSAPVVSSEEIQTYAPVATENGTPLFLLTHLVGRQIVMIAGRNLLVERDAMFHDFTVNGTAFDGARTEARRGPHVMYRDTDHGLRYYVKQGDTRVVSDHPTTKAKAAALGITLDPSYAFPLPIFGINYLNFSFGTPDTQFAMLFGGVLAAINVQRPKVPHTPFDASVDFFGIAVPSSDRRYDTAGEHPDERVITWPITTGLNLGWQYTPFQKATFQYQFRFDGYHADTTTSDGFVVPSSTITNGIGGAYEYRRGGYSFVANGAWYGRGSWKRWGLPDAAGELPGAERTYLKFSGNLSRDFYLSPVQKLHFNGAYFGGRRLDRFSRYQFGLFDDTRIHGVPASGVRFDDLAMARGSYTFDLLELYRVDLFLEQAWGRDLSAGRDWRPITGFGTALNLRAPFNTILRVDLGHARLPSEYRGIGSTVLQVLVLKPLGS